LMYCVPQNDEMIGRIQLEVEERAIADKEKGQKFKKRGTKC
jgi:hypothetical protein